jgi:uncharacterized protein
LAALFAIFAFLQIAGAQVLRPSYGFLELVDYKNEAVADARVVPLSGNSSDRRQTDRKGRLENGIPHPFSAYAIFNFSIEKDGYYPFYDYFGVFQFLGEGGRSNPGEPIRIELLKIPQNRAERKAVGTEPLKREFFGAARKGEAAAVRRFIKSGLSPNLTTSDLRGVPATPDVPIIIFAARSGSGETVKEFLSAGVDVRKKDDWIRSLLAVYLQAYPSRINYPETEAGRRELLNEYENGAESLIEAGAVIDSDAWLIAVEKGYLRTVKKLLAKGAPVNALDSSERNALLTAIQTGRTEMIDFLLEKGADPNILFADADLDNSYFSYCISSLMAAVESKDVNLIKRLLAGKADPNLTCKNGKNALRVALKIEKYDIFDLLIEAGASANPVDLNGATNLMYAARNEDPAAVKKMLKLGVPVNARNNAGATALMIAVRYGSMYSRFEKARLLLEAGADPNIVAGEKTSGSSGDQSENCESALIDIAAEADLDSIQNKPLSIVDLLIANRADVNFTCRDGQTALFRAIYNGQVKGVKKLLEAGAAVKGEKGRAALEYARKVPNYEYNKDRMNEIIKLLEAAGAK